MQKCIEHCNDHTNVFVNLNGIPYLLAEYLDDAELRQVNRSDIKSEIVIDQSDAMRAIIDVTIDDIGKRVVDGLPDTVGNRTKQKKLLQMIDAAKDQPNYQFGVLRRGIVMRVNYQLENSRTRQVIRSMSEDLKIPNRNYFLDINSNDINDNAIIVNFNDSIVSTVNEFTHGMDRMVLRVTNIQMMYEVVKNVPKMPRPSQTFSGNANTSIAGGDPNDPDYYRYHNELQHHHVIGDDPAMDNNFSIGVDSLLEPAPWMAFNRFYQFSEDTSSIILHGQEINDKYTQTVLIPCGTVTVNRAFIINPGHRLIFKFSVWKNDCTVVNDTCNIARLLRVHPLRPMPEPCHCHHHHEHDHCHGDHHHDDHCPDFPPRPPMPNADVIISELKAIGKSDEQQNQVINQMMGLINNIQGLINNYHDKDNESKCNCDTAHNEINSKIDMLSGNIISMEKDLNNRITNISSSVDGIEAKVDNKIAGVGDKIATLTNKIDTIELDVNSKITDVTDAVDAFKLDVDNRFIDVDNKINDLTINTDIDTKLSTVTNKVDQLEADTNTNITNITNSITALSSDVDTKISDADAKIADVKNSIAAITDDIDDIKGSVADTELTEAEVLTMWSSI